MQKTMFKTALSTKVIIGAALTFIAAGPVAYGISLYLNGTTPPQTTVATIPTEPTAPVEPTLPQVAPVVASSELKFTCSDGMDPKLTTSGGCGNGIINAGEECDDGNTAGGDGCSGCETVCAQNVSKGTGGNVFFPIAQATACADAGECGGSDRFSCINGQCQNAVCGDGVCNDCSNAFSPCTLPVETNYNCSADCGKEVCRLDCSKACRKEGTLPTPTIGETYSNLTYLTSAKTLRDQKLPAQGDAVYGIRHAAGNKSFALSSMTKDWVAYYNMVVMRSRPNCSGRLPNKQDMDDIYALITKNGMHTASDGVEVNGETFYWGNWAAGQNPTTFVNGPEGCYWVYIHNYSTQSELAELNLTYGSYEMIFTEIAK